MGSRVRFCLAMIALVISLVCVFASVDRALWDGLPSASASHTPEAAVQAP